MKKISLQQRKRRRFWIGALVFLFLALVWPWLPWTKRWGDQFLDFQYRFFNRTDWASEKVVMIDIDEQSLKVLGPDFGRWPWPRRFYKDLIEFLSRAEPKGILFDILFSEPMREKYDDEVFAEVSSSVPGVSHAMNLLEDVAYEMEDSSGFFPLPEGFSEKFALTWAKPPQSLPVFKRKFKDHVVSLSNYPDKIKNYHVVTIEQDKDGVFRRVPLVFHYGENWLPSLALKGSLFVLENIGLDINSSSLNILEKGVSSRNIPLDSDGLMRIHYYRSDRGPKVVPAGPVFSSALQLQRGEVEDESDLKVNPREFDGCVVVVGGSAIGLQDLKVTPVSASYPGALIQATAISNILKGDFLRFPPSWLSYALSLLIIGLVYWGCFFIQSSIWRVGFGVGILTSYLGLGLCLFRFQSVALDLASSLILGSIALLDGVSYIAFLESSEKRQIKSTLLKYVSPVVADALTASGTDPRAEVGHETEISIFFMDIRSFTTYSENLSPQQVVKKLNAYLEDMTGFVLRFNGTIDKFIGDAVMAFWGAPLHEPEHALKAVRCGLEMQKLLAIRRKEAKHDENVYAFKSGIGINTGMAVVGNIGSENRLDYTVIGDNVNLASRIEGLTSFYKVPILIGEATYDKIKNIIYCRRLGKGQVKGRVGSVNLYEPLAEFSDSKIGVFRAFGDAFEQALQLYEQGKFDEALNKFNSINESMEGGDPPSQFFAEHCMGDLWLNKERVAG